MQFDTHTHIRTHSDASKRNGIAQHIEQTNSIAAHPPHHCSTTKSCARKSFCVLIPLQNEANAVIVLVHISSNPLAHRVITFIPRFCVTLHSQSMFIELEEKWFTLGTHYSLNVFNLNISRNSINFPSVHKTFLSPFLLSFVCPLYSFFSFFFCFAIHFLRFLTTTHTHTQHSME